MTDKVDINTRYPEELETMRPDGPYQDLYEVISSIFDFKTVGSLIDIGCSDGNLLKIVNQNHRDLKVAGIEYFDYHKKHADASIVDKIRFIDIRDPLPDDLKDQKFDIVICTEVGEHIDPSYAEAFLANVKSLTGGYLIMTWSCHGGEHDRANDPLHQHLNPLSFDLFFKLMSDNGFLYQHEVTTDSIEHIRRKSSFYSWWRESFTVWEPAR